MPGIDVFDHVRIAPTPETERLGFAGRVGVCTGITTPSVTGVQVIGEPKEDFAVAVEVGPGESIWFAFDLVEFVDHNPGATMRIADKTFVRAADGSWHRTNQN